MIWDYGRITNPRIPPKSPLGQLTLRSKGVDFFEPFLRRLNLPDGLDLHFTWRHPDTRTAARYLSFKDGHDYDDIYANDVSLFHQDNESWRWIAVWSTNAPTEVCKGRRGAYDPIRLGTKHLTVIDNKKCLHRTGRYNYDPRTRHFVRIGIPATRGRWAPDPDKLVDF